ncbi:hypothetical protein ACJIZ3_012899 [Penstemon smallii]|uniref:Knottins-like domain-containing protein n=1 Tax=Penstemon smallii TaxID=265156 RepID=A0ABD3URX1_9LAMI
MAICQSPSFTFRGLCFRKHNCKEVCLNEGFTDGSCKGLLRRCYCQKPCPSQGNPSSINSSNYN